jgi:hypothetical protein
MQQHQISHSHDINRLVAEGYDLEVIGGHLLIRHIPFVTPLKEIQYGTLVCILTLAGPNLLGPPQDHTIYFCGETPCHADGSKMDSIINNSTKIQLTEEILADHYFSSKPTSGNYTNYYDKIRTYSEILSAQAKIIDPTVTTRPNRTKAA